MKQLTRLTAIFFPVAVLFSACTGVPDHARYVPADAVFVMGVNTKEMSKEIAWSAVTGSKVLDDLKKEDEKEAVKDLEHAGINWMSTSYLYVRADDVQKTTVVAGVLPLKSKSEWEAFIKKQFTGVAFKQVNGRTDAQLDSKLYAGWTDHVLIVMNTIAPGAINGSPARYYDDAASDSTEMPAGAPAPAAIAPVADMGVMMDSAFAIDKNRSVTQDKRFAKLEKEGHDMTMWVNYDAMMNLYMGEAMTKAMGLSLSNSLWKGSAMASGIDFKKGKVTSDMLYYSSEDLKDVSKELGRENADKEMIDRLPIRNMNMIMAWHLSPKGLKGTIEKAGMLGIVNLGLMSVGMSADDIFDTFTGDMAVSVCNFSTHTESNTTADAVTHATYTSDADYIYAMKIAKKENLAKLLNVAVSKEILKPAGNNMYQLAGETANPLVIANDDHYLVVTNKAEAALAYMQGKDKGGKLPDEAQKALYGHPAGGYFDITTAAKALVPAGDHTDEAEMVEEVKKLLTDINFYGGSFNGSAFDSHITANFVNKEENGLLQLLQFAMKAKKLAGQHRLHHMSAMSAVAADTTVVTP